ncbi:MAG TPA: hypothetical protein VL294_11515 [Pseudolysinimonas sp.]|jgi:hypothetical protein|nr:hypothetical protein [Pseudolysinimonas sp.]
MSPISTAITDRPSFRKEETRMEHPRRRLREPGTEQSTGLLTREQEQHAAARIARGLEAAEQTGSGIDADTARIIAAALHTGYGSHLEHFAATGALNPTAALNELDGGSIELHQLPWVAALWDFLERIHNPDPDQPESEHDEPAPQVFVQPRDPHLDLQPSGGRWLDANQHPDDLAAQIDAIAAENPGSTAEVSAWVGFHQLMLPPRIDAEDVAAYAQGVAQLGEPYALHAIHVGAPLAPRDVLARHEGTYESMTAFVAHAPKESLAYALSKADPDIDPARAHALDEFEEILRRSYLCLEGTEGVHVFHRYDGNSRGGHRKEAA